MKGLAVLGSSGVVGSLALEVVKDFPNDFKVVSLVSKKGTSKFKKQIKEFKPKIEVVTDRDGEEAMIKAVEDKEVDLVVVAVVGMAGLKPCLAAIEAGKDIALATKEVLVVAGELVMKKVKENRVNLIPLDSEHSAVFQSLKSGERKEIKRIYITMGKGKISVMSREELKKIGLKEVLKRDTWTMGNKIAVDSATCMNKAFEVVEAKHLFDLRPEQIKIVVHPEYGCHSLVEFKDGSLIAEFGEPSMKRYVQYGMFYPERREIKGVKKFELVGKSFSFEKPNINKFKALKLGYKAILSGGTMPAVMHGADRVVVEKFEKGELGFVEMIDTVEEVMDKHKAINNPGLKQLIKAEEWGAEKAREWLI
ncbi:MAG: 1-deoxy-D-xylulose-5-phosphate reductoisomerase [Candidatus Beckwithbacteria bacterium]